MSDPRKEWRIPLAYEKMLQQEMIAADCRLSPGLRKRAARLAYMMRKIIERVPEDG